MAVWKYKLNHLDYSALKIVCVRHTHTHTHTHKTSSWIDCLWKRDSEKVRFCFCVSWLLSHCTTLEALMPKSSSRSLVLSLFLSTHTHPHTHTYTHAHLMVSWCTCPCIFWACYQSTVGRVCVAHTYIYTHSRYTQSTKSHRKRKHSHLHTHTHTHTQKLCMLHMLLRSSIMRFIRKVLFLRSILIVCTTRE